MSDNENGGGRPSLPPSARSSWPLRVGRAWWAGVILISQLAGGLLLYLTLLLVHTGPEIPGVREGYYALSATVLIPLIMGVVQSLCWRAVRVTRGAFWGLTLLNTAVGLVSASFFLREGTVCLIMAAPLLWLLITGGAALSNAFTANRPLQVSLVPLLLAGIVFDGRAAGHHYEGTVTTRLRVNAPAAAVARYIVAFPPIADPPRFWLCRTAGLPYPVRTTADGAFVGAARRCEFSGGIVIGERITQIVPGKSVAFDVTAQPHYPEIAGHAVLRWGKIAVEDNGDGTSTLVGTSRYVLRVFPAAYFHLWADYVIHGVHDRVFDHIRRLAEHDARRD